jgi:predicted Fe-S protein YdhL (DUF1289 family)
MITPCIGICKISELTQTCEACCRTAEEIREWHNYTSEQRMEIMRRLGYGKRMGREERLRRYERG